VSQPALCRMRITFREGEAIKYISHLDLLRAWERTFRRAGLPLAYSQGFNPHPRIVIAMPLPVGCTGEREVVDIWLDEPLSPSALVEALDPALPLGLSVVEARVVPLRGPALPTLISCAVYQIALDGVSVDEIAARVERFMARETLEVQFRRKTFDLRPLVGALTVQKVEPHPVLEAVLLRDRSGRIGRPDVLLEALGLGERARRVHRLRIAFEGPEDEVSVNS
jgi:radical SAM-linked protein